MEKQWKQWQPIFGGSKFTSDGDCSHEIKRCIILGRKAMTNLDSILKSRDTTLPTKFHLVKAMVFPVVMYGCESWTIKKAKHWRIDAFELWCWRRILRVPWTARRSNKSILKEISSEYSGRTDAEAKTPILWPQSSLDHTASWWPGQGYCSPPSSHIPASTDPFNHHLQKQSHPGPQHKSNKWTEWACTLIN